MFPRKLMRAALAVTASSVALKRKRTSSGSLPTYKHVSSGLVDSPVTSAQPITSTMMAVGYWNGTIDISRAIMKQVGPVRSIAKLTDDAFATSDGSQIGVWDIDSQRKLRAFGPAESATIADMVGFSNSWLAVVRWGSQRVEIWDAEKGDLKWTLKGHTDDVKYISALPRNRLASYAWDRTIRIWNLDNGECERVIESGYAGSLLALPDDTLVTTDLAGIKVWVDGKCAKEIAMPDLPWNPRIALAADGTLLITAFKTAFRAVDFQTTETKDVYSLLTPDSIVALKDKVVTFGPSCEMNVFEQ